MTSPGTVLVTGGAGFIGANLTRVLLETGAAGAVRVLDDLSTGAERNLEGQDVELHVGSVLDEEALDKACIGVSSVVHLAARSSVPRSIDDPVASHEANATGTVRVLEAVRRHVDHLVVASSSSVYGANPELPKHEGLTPAPRSPYAASKLATEAYALAWSQVWGTPTLAFRFFNVYGPLQPANHAYAAVVPAFVSAALDGRPLPIHGDGRQTRDFTYVDSLCSVLAAAVAGRVGHPEPVNLAFGGRSSLLDVVELLEGILGHPLERAHSDPRAGDVRDTQADQTRLRSLFPDLQPVELDEGLRRTVDWHRSLR